MQIDLICHCFVRKNDYINHHLIRLKLRTVSAGRKFQELNHKTSYSSDNRTDDSRVVCCLRDQAKVEAKFRTAKNSCWASPSIKVGVVDIRAADNRQFKRWVDAMAERTL